MRIESIRLHYFRRHIDTFVRFAAEGITGIMGANESGKSTLLEAFLFAIYGSPAVRGKMDTIRSKSAPAKRRPEVELVIQLDERYRIRRSDRDAQVFIGDSDEPVAAGTSVVNEYLQTLIGASLDEFLAGQVSRQKDIERLGSMSGTPRQMFVRKVMGIERIDRALEACRKRKNTLSSEREGLAAGLGEREPLAGDVATAIEARDAADNVAGDAGDAEEAAHCRAGDANDALAESTALKEQHDAAVQRRTQAEADARAARAELARLKTDLEDAAEARAIVAECETALAELPALRTRRDQLQSAEAIVRRRAELEKALADAEAEVRTYQGYITEADAALAAHDAAKFAEHKETFRKLDRRLNDAISERRSRHAAATTENKAAGVERIRLTRRLEQLERQGPEGACPSCTKALGEHYDAVIAALRDDLQRITATEEAAYDLTVQLADSTDDELAMESELEELRERGEELRTLETNAKQADENRPKWARQVETSTARVNAIRTDLSNVPDVKVDPAELERVFEMITEIEERDLDITEPIKSIVDGKNVQLPSVRERASRFLVLQEQRTAAERRLADFGSEIDRAEAAIAAVGFDADSHAYRVTTAEAAAAELSTARAALAAAQEQKRAADAALAKAEQALAAYDARAGQLEELTRKVRVHEQAAAALDAFRVAAAGTLRPEMEELMSGFLSVLTDGLHETVTITEDFEVVCQEGGIDMEVVSGGAEDIVALAQRVAMAIMVAHRRGKPLSFLWLDEPFGSLDETRRPAVLDFFRQLSSTFPQLILTSHVDETRFIADHLITVVRDDANMCSRVVLHDGEPMDRLPELVPAGVAA